MTQLQAPPPRQEKTRARVPKGLVIALAVIIVAGGAIWGGVAWWHHHQAEVTAAADTATGNEALQQARTEINALNTMDYHSVNADYQAWLNATTGTLYGQLTQGATGLKQQFQLGKMVTTGSITLARVAAADSAKGTATILGTETVNVSLSGRQTVRHNGFRADLIRTAAGWRLNDFTTTQMK